MADTTQTWVVSVVGLPEASGGQAAGFNLDNLDSGEGSDGTCEEFAADFTGINDPAHVGVDNALQGLVGTIETAALDADDCGGSTDGCLDRTLQQQIAEGSLLLIMEVSGINDYVFDDSVMVQLALGEVPGGGMPMVGGDGQLAAGQTFNSMQTLGTPVSGDIFRGRLRAQTNGLTININAGGFMLPLVISDAQIRFDVATDGSSLSNGLIGGSILGSDIVAAVTEIDPDLVETAEGLISTLADISPSAADSQVCEAVSVGLTFAAVNATVN
ncbi:MAG: hypothetical protein AB8I08_38565 [Sandaracinaceae bacterium]